MLLLLLLLLLLSSRLRLDFLRHVDIEQELRCVALLYLHGVTHFP
jgi:hypothetical protein